MQMSPNAFHLSIHQSYDKRGPSPHASPVRLTLRLLRPQITWIYEPKEGDRINIAVFHPSFAPNYPDSPMNGRVSFSPTPPKLASPSIQITEVRMTDEGRYICEYATYPIGNEQGITYLVMLGKSHT